MDERMSGDSRDVAEMVKEELERVAFASIGDVVDQLDAECWRPLEGIPAENLPAVASIKVKDAKGAIDREIRMYDKLKALEMLVKMQGMFGEGNPGGDAPVIVDDIPPGIKGATE